MKQAKQQTQKQLLSEVLARAFGGSANLLVMQALQIKKLSPNELEEIRDLIDGLEDKQS